MHDHNASPGMKINRVGTEGKTTFCVTAHFLRYLVDANSEAEAIELAKPELQAERDLRTIELFGKSFPIENIRAEPADTDLIEFWNSHYDKLQREGKLNL